MGKAKQQRFRAVLERGDRALGWTIARVPFEPGEVWAKMVRLRVRGTVNGFEFRTSLFPQAGGGFFLLVNKGMQKGGGVCAGEMAEFVLEPDLEERPAELPDELAVLLDEEPGLREWYDGLTEYTRRMFGGLVTAPKSAEAKMRKAEMVAELMLSAMEAEVELPPLIVAAFKKRPKAKAGWEKMTPLQRRGELLGVFYYKSPEAREKRVGKLCDLAEKKAGR